MARIAITINSDNTVMVAALDGTFDEAKPKIEAVLRNLGVAGIQFTQLSEVEQHRHGPDMTIVATQPKIERR